MFIMIDFLRYVGVLVTGNNGRNWRKPAPVSLGSSKIPPSQPWIRNYRNIKMDFCPQKMMTVYIKLKLSDT